jgi:hypothetical protein
MKKCSQCGQEKEFEMFCEKRTSKDGLRSECKECLKIYSKKCREKYKENNLKYKENNLENELSKKVCNECKIEKELKEYNKKISNKDGLSYSCKDCISIENKIYKEKNKEKNKEYNKEYYLKNKEYYSNKAKEYNVINKEKNKNKNKKYYLNNKEYFSEYTKNRKKTDYLFKLKLLIRTSITNCIKKRGYTKNTKTYKILGCSYEEFKLYLESKFEFWMNWDKHGKYNGEFYYGWDIDHIIPISSADTEDDIIRLNHYTNLQPLCSKINRDIKRDRLDY